MNDFDKQTLRYRAYDASLGLKLVTDKLSTLEYDTRNDEIDAIYEKEMWGYIQYCIDEWKRQTEVIKEKLDAQN